MALGRAKAGRRRQRYSSSLRERQKAFTHDLVMRSVSELVAEGKILTFTVQDVADRAGVSYAAVYRHFPTRQVLLEEMNDWALEIARPRIPPDPGAIDDLPSWVEGVFLILEENAGVVQAMAVASTALDLRFRRRAQRDRMIEGLVRDAAPNLSEEDRRHAFAVIRLLVSSQTWVAMRRRFGLDSKGSTLAITWALRALIEDVKRRNVQSPSRRPGARKEAIR